MVQRNRLSALYNVEKCMIGNTSIMSTRNKQLIISNSILFSIQFQGIHLNVNLLVWHWKFRIHLVYDLDKVRVVNDSFNHTISSVC